MKKKLIYLLPLLLLAVAVECDLLFGQGMSDGVAIATVSFAALTHTAGENNMGGYKNYLAFIPANICTAVPALPASPTDNDDLVMAAGSFAFTNGTSPVFIYATDSTVKYDAEAVGERDGISFNQKGEFFFPGAKKEMHAFNSLIKNQSGYLVLIDSDGNQLLVGSKGLEATIKPGFSGGQKRADLRGTKYEFEAPSNETAVYLETPLVFEPENGYVGLTDRPTGTGSGT